ncbi:alpha/beta fold hydrolase [Singulisphaera rosea]
MSFPLPLRLGTARILGSSWTRGIAWGCLLAATGMLVKAEATRPELPSGVVTHGDLLYRVSGGRKVRLDLYLPNRPAPPEGWPAVVAIHGGGWRGGSKELVRPMAIELAQHGYAVAAIDYRLSKPGSPSWPDNFEDVRESVRWLRQHASDYGVDSDRIAALGSSAGGHLSVLLGAYPDGPVLPEGRPRTPSDDRVRTAPHASARVKAVIDFYGPVDLANLHPSAPDSGSPVPLMLGGRPAAVPGRCEAATPLTHISNDDPPMLLIHGNKDSLVPLEQSEKLASALTESGVPHRLIVVDAARHGFGFKAGDRDLLPDILAFLDSTIGKSSQ